jgi:hypothetical protein
MPKRPVKRESGPATLSRLSGHRWGTAPLLSSAWQCELEDTIADSNVRGSDVRRCSMPVSVCKRVVVNRYSASL